MKIFDALKWIAEGLNSISMIKRPDIIIDEVAEKKDIKNKTRAKRHELKRLKIEKKIEKFDKK